MRTGEERKKWKEKKKKKKKKKKKRRRKMGALHHFSASAVAREGSCEGARGCLLMVRITVQKRDHFAGRSKIESRERKVRKLKPLRSENIEYFGG